jgi:hypothetical protein
VRVDRRDDDISVVIQQRNDLFGRRIGDASEAAQIAEPDDGIDAIRDTTHDASAEHAPRGIATEIGLHQRPGHARERSRLECQRKRRDHAH